jgi:hypothetical protein
MSEQRDLCRPQRLNLQSNKKRVERLERIKWAVNVPPRSYLAGSEGVVARGRLQAEGGAGRLTSDRADNAIAIADCNDIL